MLVWLEYPDSAPRRPQWALPLFQELLQPSGVGEGQRRTGPFPGCRLSSELVEGPVSSSVKCSVDFSKWLNGRWEDLTQVKSLVENVQEMLISPLLDQGMKVSGAVFDWFKKYPGPAGLTAQEAASGGNQKALESNSPQILALPCHLLGMCF